MRRRGLIGSCCAASSNRHSVLRHNVGHYYSRYGNQLYRDGARRLQERGQELLGHGALHQHRQSGRITTRLDRADHGTHRLRRTKATLIYQRTKNLRAVQLLLWQTKLESTVRYLGIEVNDALEMAEQTEV